MYTFLLVFTKSTYKKLTKIYMKGFSYLCRSGETGMDFVIDTQT